MRTNKPYNRQRKQTQFYFLNYRIPAAELRILDNEGRQLGVMTRDEAITVARGHQMDLVLIAPKANPPVAKITDFKKFLYTQEKKLKEAKKGAKKSVVKDIQVSLFIGPADLERMINRTKEFLSDGNQVRLNLALRGREVMKRDMGFDLLHKFIAELGEVNVSKEPRLEGRVIRVVVAPKK